LRTRLLERTTRRMTPTESGEQLYASTKGLLSALNDALETINHDSQAISGQLKVLMPDIRVLTDAAVSFCVEHSAISLCCETSLSPKEDLLDGFDLIVTFSRGKLADSGWIAKEIARWRSVVVASPDLIKRYGKPYKLSELSQLPCVSSLTALNGTPWIFKGINGKHVRQSVSSPFKVNSGHMARAAALAGLGFAILPEHACLPELHTGLLEPIELEAEPEDLVLHVFYAGRKHLPPKVSAFIEHLQVQLNTE
ncbi:LysR substrate-binding domain-containing protein, partial [Photobacterium sp. OFAV2-7]|uniref:LysR substrate-binding domain-containing protein n=1 Tax=Photobacterium sp. OFAV2-7 TaxID=2917748 RepID=UPI001EF5B0C6